MPKQKITCETVTVSVADEQGNVTKFVVPAYTRGPIDMQATLEGLVAEYLQRSEREDEGTSLGDFALFALSQAEQDPFVQ